jgi:rod shape-determining protein MreC
MRHISVEPPPFFHRGPSPLSRLAFFGLLSLALLFTDTRYRYLENVRQVVAVALYPLQRALQMPGKRSPWSAPTFRRNARWSTTMRSSSSNCSPTRRSCKAIRSSRRKTCVCGRCRAVESRFHGAATTAEVSIRARPVYPKIFIDKGDAAGVQPGQAVIDEIGVVGQVTRVFPYMAEVTLVTDKDHAVPVKVERTGVRSVMYGAGTGRLPELRFLSPNAEIQPGDRLLTSGIDGTYPAGLAVAQVASVERETGQMFARVTCKPLAGVDASQHVLILGNAAAAMPRPEEPAEADAPRKGRRRRS